MTEQPSEWAITTLMRAMLDVDGPPSYRALDDDGKDREARRLFLHPVNERQGRRFHAAALALDAAEARGAEREREARKIAVRIKDHANAQQKAMRESLRYWREHGVEAFQADARQVAERYPDDMEIAGLVVVADQALASIGGMLRGRGTGSEAGRGAGGHPCGSDDGSDVRSSYPEAAPATPQPPAGQRCTSELRAIGRRIVTEAQTDTTPGSPFAARIEEAAVRVLREELTRG